ncbi:GNAT family N-acetyltransferase [Anoxybacillus rupiensis]|uniref:GNAT family N-acetyltransferase n=1 Tax=Anoxybacteroides rupiense TaxID=311460 RepID=A0ABT5W492_9BACL|nr:MULTISPECIES: GNAT family N-acetyltransferase [Anoxybacillus]KXG09287.1 hypothetical protein AT864_02517 [Anoxybacillus sp. P3H1B]MDE8564112.1 GNAT family N-acetyltransferase [Anoxybacillus rupiensis]
MEEIVAPMTFEHLQECIELYIRVFHREPWNENWTYEAARERLTDLLHTPKFIGFVCKQREAILGFIAGHSKASDQGMAFYLAELCIDQKAQGKGYGSQLLQVLEEELQKQHVKSIYLLTSAYGAAAAFYRKNGYTVRADRIVMKKSL